MFSETCVLEPTHSCQLQALAPSILPSCQHVPSLLLHRRLLFGLQAPSVLLDLSPLLHGPHSGLEQSWTEQKILRTEQAAGAATSHSQSSLTGVKPNWQETKSEWGVVSERRQEHVDRNNHLSHLLLTFISLCCINL